MPFFRPRSTPAGAESSSTSEIAYTLVDLAAAILFLIGSILFFRDATYILGVWMYVFGSLCFMVRPTIRLAGEVRLWRTGPKQQ